MGLTGTSICGKLILENDMKVDDLIEYLQKNVPIGSEIGVAFGCTDGHPITTNLEVRCVRATKLRRKNGYRYATDKAKTELFVIRPKTRE